MKVMLPDDHKKKNVSKNLSPQQESNPKPEPRMLTAVEKVQRKDTIL